MKERLACVQQEQKECSATFLGSQRGHMESENVSVWRRQGQGQKEWRLGVVIVVNGAGVVVGKIRRIRIGSVIRNRLVCRFK